MGTLNLPYTTGTNYTYDSSKIEVSGGLAKLKVASGAMSPVNYYRQNEGAGTTIADEGSSGQDGSATSGITWTTGKFGNALLLDSSHYGFMGANALDYEYTDAFSISLWVNQKGNSNGNQVFIARKKSTSPYTGIEILYQNGRIYFTMQGASAHRRSKYCTKTLDTSSWYNITVTYDGTGVNGINIYIDGVAQTLTSYKNESLNSIKTSIVPRIGSEDGGNRAFAGAVDEVAIFDYELSQSEVDYIYNNGDGRSDITGGYSSGDIVNNTALTSGASGVDVQYKTFIETAGTNNAGDLRYQLSSNGSDFYYWTGTAWGLANSGQYNDANTINNNIESFDASADQLFVKAFLISDGSQEVELDNIDIEYTFEDEYGVGHTAKVYLVSTKDADNTAKVAFEGTNNADNTAYVGNKDTNNIDNTGTVALSNSKVADNTAKVSLSDNEPVDNTAEVSLIASKVADNTAKVALPDNKGVDNTAYVGTKTSKNIDNKAYVFTGDNYGVDNKAEVSINDTKGIDNTGSVGLSMNKAVGNKGTVSDTSTKNTDNTAKVVVSVGEAIGNKGSVELQGSGAIGHTALVVLKKGVNNTAEVLSAPQYFEIRAAEVFINIDAEINTKEL